MRRLLKVVLLAFICTVGAMGLVLGGLYLFGALDEKPVYATSLSFSEAEVVKSGPFSLTVSTTTKDVNKTTLLLETSKSPNGEKIISYPKYITIGEPFHIAPILTEDEIPVGGYLELYAKYEGEGSNQSVVATCKILIDVPVNSAKLNIDTSNLKQGASISLSKANITELSEILNINSANSLMPYTNSTQAMDAIASGTLFAGQNVVNKKIFLKITSADSSDTIPARFQITEGGTTTTVTETELTYAYANGKLVATKTISIVPFGDNVGEFSVNAYVCTSYANNATEIADLDNVSKVSTAHQISVINYTIDMMSLLISGSEIYLGQETKVYLNSTATDGINLGINLIASDTTKTLDQLSSFLNENIFLKFEDRTVGGIVVRSDNSQTDTDAEYGLNCESGFTEMDQWYFKIYISNYQKYLDYQGDNSKKIKLIVSFYDKKGSIESKTIEQEFYFIPKITEVDKVESSQYTFSAMSGSKLIFNQNNYSIKFKGDPVGIANDFKIVHYVKGSPQNGKIVLNGVTIESEFTQKTLNSETISLFDPKNATVTGSGKFSIFSQASYDDSKAFYFLGENCQTDVEVVESISYIDCYSYENNKAVNFTKFEFDENEKESGNSITRYLYVTTSEEQLSKLKNFVTNKKLKVSVRQLTDLSDETLYNNATMGSGLKDQNQDTIKFSDETSWEEVCDASGKLLGFKKAYTIGEVWTLIIDNHTVPNIFGISVYLDISPVQVTTNYKVAKGTTIQYEVKDKILQKTILSLDSGGTTKDNPIELKATVNGGNLSWPEKLSKLTYGFAYDEKSGPDSLLGYDAKFEIVDNSTLKGVYTFQANTESFTGGLNFSTLPYKEGGYLGKFTFWCATSTNENSVKKWNGTSFGTVVNPSLEQKVLYFKLSPINLTVEKNSATISGKKDSSINIFKKAKDDTSYLFTLKSVEGSTEGEIYSENYSQFLSVSGVVNNQGKSNITIDIEENQVKTTSDFISSGDYVTFKFLCKDSPINIGNSEDGKVNITGAFAVSQIESTEGKFLGEKESTPLSAPMLTALSKNDYLNITYGGEAVNNSFVEGYTLSFEKKADTAEWLVLNSDGSITLKTINDTGVVSTSFNVKISNSTSTSTESGLFSVTIYAKSSILATDLIIKKTNMEENEISAGKDNGVAYGNGISFKQYSSLASLSSNITGVSLTVDYTNSTVKNFIKSANFEKTTTSSFSSNAFGFYAGDLASDQRVDISFAFTFGEAGTFNISKTITVEKNISLTPVTKRKTVTNPNGYYNDYDFVSGEDFQVFKTESYKENVTFDSSIYTDTTTSHEHIISLENLSVGNAGDVLVLLARYKKDDETENGTITASFVLVYVYKEGDLQYEQNIKLEFIIKLASKSQN